MIGVVLDAIAQADLAENRTPSADEFVDYAIARCMQPVAACR